MENGNVSLWMNLMGFEMTDEDSGVERFLNNTGFKPDSVFILLGDPDFIHQYPGMKDEYVLKPNNCSYNAVPRNAERERQPWTNYKLRTLVLNLKNHGIKTYASVFGSMTKRFYLKEWHNGWLSEHLELTRFGRLGVESAPEQNLCPFKRFKDGSYYEDFLAKKLREVLQDFDFQGVHFGDSYSPITSAPLSWLDFSTDLVEQYLNYTGDILPAEIKATMGNDYQEAEYKRYTWFYGAQREKWVNFIAWRWNSFFKKISTPIHALGKEITTLGMYCTDPFETRYCLGTDLKGIIDSGVDCITANVVATGLYVAGNDSAPDEFNRFMSIIPMLSACVSKENFLCFLGLQDSTEEWDLLHDAPVRHVRDMYNLMSYVTIDKNGLSRAADGFYMCLADGLSKTDWKWEREHLEIALSTKDKIDKCLSPMMLWSDNLNNNLLHEYIENRCWTPFKLFYELANEGCLLGGIVKIDGVKHYSGTLIVPNFNLLSEKEKQEILAYKRGPVICTASPNFDLSKYNIYPSVYFQDNFSKWPMKCFALNCSIPEVNEKNEVMTEIEKLLSEDDGNPNLSLPSLELQEYVYVFHNTLRFAKVTTGFFKAIVLLLKTIDKCQFISDEPIRVLKMKDGANRLYVFNSNSNKYHRALIHSNKRIKEVKVISKFPLQTPGFSDEMPKRIHFIDSKDNVSRQNIIVKIQPAGVTILDIYCEE